MPMSCWVMEASTSLPVAEQNGNTHKLFTLTFATFKSIWSTEVSESAWKLILKAGVFYQPPSALNSGCVRCEAISIFFFFMLFLPAPFPWIWRLKWKGSRTNVFWGNTTCHHQEAVLYCPFQTHFYHPYCEPNFFFPLLILVWSRLYSEILSIVYLGGNTPQKVSCS